MDNYAHLSKGRFKIRRLDSKSIHRNSTQLLGASFEHLPKLFSVFATILETDLVDDELGQRIVNIMKQMQQSFSADLLQKAWSSLTPEQQAKLQRQFSK
jgi:HJR/Mrr/RecB family endonuclease